MIIIVATEVVLPFAHLTFQILVHKLKVRDEFIFPDVSNLPSLPQTTYLQPPSTNLSEIWDSVGLLLFNTPFGNPAMPKRQRTNLLQRTSSRSRTST